MTVRKFSVFWWLTAIPTIALISAIGYITLREVCRFSPAKKTLRNATATVEGKEYVRFDEENASFVNDEGTLIHVHPGTEQWRVYYRIDRFENVDEPLRCRLLNAEAERSRLGRQRFLYEGKEWYDKSEVGDRLIVRYRWLGNDVIEIVNVEHPPTLGSG